VEHRIFSILGKQEIDTVPRSLSGHRQTTSEAVYPVVVVYAFQGWR
jgi:hypothetical protein